MAKLHLLMLIQDHDSVSTVLPLLTPYRPSFVLLQCLLLELYLIVLSVFIQIY
ncbi:hypothetical protein LEMLEM_LOCUS7498 [Lemmus lemmus]